MRKFWRLLSRVVFWSYERGSLPYDLMVIAILVFVLLTPRSWYHDRPETARVASADTSGRIQLVDVNASSHIELFRIDASLLNQPPSQLEQETRQVLDRGVTSLHGRSFEIVAIDPDRDGQGRVTGYDVRVKPSSPSPSR